MFNGSTRFSDEVGNTGPFASLKFIGPTGFFGADSLVATVGMSVYPSLEDLKLETLLPADEATRAWFMN